MAGMEIRSNTMSDGVPREEFIEHKRDHKEEHDRIWEVLEKVRNRLPNWAVFAMSAGTAIIGILATVALSG